MSTTPQPQPAVLVTPAQAAAPADGGPVDILIRIQAPDRPESMSGAAKRLPLRLALVIDRSGSMSGQPLEEALRCAEYIAGGLAPQDKVAVVVYDDEVQTPVSLRPGGDASAVRAALANIDSGGSTALFDGWQVGARLLEGTVAQSVSRVLLLSDGQANQGLCDPTQIEQHCARWAAKGVTTTTVGLGRGFNEDLMIGMARAGDGQHYYGQTAEDLHDSFDEELSLLQSLFMRKLRIKLVPGTGVIAEPHGLVRRDASGLYLLPDLAWGAEAWMLVRLHLVPDHASDPRQPKPLLAMVLDGEDEQGAAIQVSQMLALPLVSASDLSGLPHDELVLRRLKEVEFADTTARIQALVAHGDVRKAKALLKSAEAQLTDHPWLADKLGSLHALLASDELMAVKEMKFSMYRTANRLVAKSESAYLGSETNSADIPAFLRRKASEGQGRGRGK